MAMLRATSNPVLRCLTRQRSTYRPLEWATSYRFGVRECVNMCSYKAAVALATIKRRLAASATGFTRSGEKPGPWRASLAGKHSLRFGNLARHVLHGFLCLVNGAMSQLASPIGQCIPRVTHELVFHVRARQRESCRRAES
jgi:hypothetical protein